MKLTTPSKSTAHIIINRFSDEDRELIKKALDKRQVRRPKFYYDAILAYATQLLEESK